MKSLATGLAAALSLTACDVTLLRDLPPDQADELLHLLDRSGVAARATNEPDRGARIDVAPAAVPGAVAALEQRRCQPQAAEPPQAAWLQTPAEERAQRALSLSRELERSLLGLPSVWQARVHLSLASGPMSLPEAQTPAAASVLLVRGASVDSQAQPARELVAGAVPGLAPEGVRVVETVRPPVDAPAPQLARLGPITVTRASAPALRGFLAAGLLVQILLAAALLRPLMRRKRRR